MSARPRSQNSEELEATTTELVVVPVRRRRWPRVQRAYASLKSRLGRVTDNEEAVVFSILAGVSLFFAVAMLGIAVDPRMRGVGLTLGIGFLVLYRPLRALGARRRQRRLSGPPRRTLRDSARGPARWDGSFPTSGLASVAFDELYRRLRKGEDVEHIIEVLVERPRFEHLDVLQAALTVVPHALRPSVLNALANIRLQLQLNGLSGRASSLGLSR